MLEYGGCLIVVTDMNRSREFYEHLLGQKVKFDFVEDVQFTGFSLHLKSHFESLLQSPPDRQAERMPTWGELYFETDDLQGIFQRLSTAKCSFVHPVIEQPWGQRVMRVLDPDGHLIEIGEKLEAVVVRLFSHGESLEKIMERTGMPKEFIENAVKKILV